MRASTRALVALLVRLSSAAVCTAAIRSAGVAQSAQTLRVRQTTRDIGAAHRRHSGRGRGRPVMVTGRLVLSVGRRTVVAMTSCAAKFCRNDAEMPLVLVEDDEVYEFQVCAGHLAEVGRGAPWDSTWEAIPGGGERRVLYVGGLRCGLAPS